MTTIYIINNPALSGRTPYDTHSARLLGELRMVFDVDDPRPFYDPVAAVAHAWRVLENFDAERDFLLWAGGDPLGLMIVVSVVSDIGDGVFKVLKWDKHAAGYLPVEINAQYRENNDDG